MKGVVYSVKNGLTPVSDCWAEEYDNASAQMQARINVLMMLAPVILQWTDCWRRQYTICNSSKKGSSLCEKSHAELSENIPTRCRTPKHPYRSHNIKTFSFLKHRVCDARHGEGCMTLSFGSNCCLGRLRSIFRRDHRGGCESGTRTMVKK